MTVALDHAPAKIVQQLLVDLVLGTLPADGDDWPVYEQKEPDGPNVPDDIITVYDTVGRMGDSGPFGKRFGFHGIQIRIRAASYAAGWAKANAIAKAMDETINYDTVTIGSDVYTVVNLNRTADIASLGRHTHFSNRYIFTINGQMPVRQTT